MPLVINTNVSSLTAQRHLGVNTNMLQKSMEKLASGFRINRAGDDAAGLQLSENLRAQIRGSQKANDNIQDGINVLNIVDGAYQTIGDNFQRIRELAVQAANDTYDINARISMQMEIVQLYRDVQRIAASTAFNGVNLLDGTATNFVLQVGANNVAANDTLDIVSALGNADPLTGPLVIGAGDLSVLDHALASETILNADGYLDWLNQQRGNLGAFINRLQGASNNLTIGIENLTASESRIRNTDIASESAKLTQAQILQQAASTILAQANQAPNLALQLLKGN